MPVSKETEAVVAAILAAIRISRHGIDKGATTRKAYVDEFLRMLHQVRNPDGELKDGNPPNPL
jgi:hypothetical protein